MVDKERVQELQDLQSRLDYSVFQTRSLVASWLSELSSTDDTSTQSLDPSDLENTSQGKGSRLFKGQRGRLGVGAKPASRTETMQNQSAAKPIAVAKREAKLKKKLTGNKSQSSSSTDTTWALASISREEDEEEEEDESKATALNSRSTVRGNKGPAAKHSLKRKPPIMKGGDFLSQYLAEEGSSNKRSKR
ncbi:hypothetical protein H4R34_003035 [Dimargaris verticillata]|uniref:Uncharacterized protein n=1 Tax=Dimargaris verticillata TaxID=2761393 RepID=A0A9W8B704_9FUNG|nr:hypothetical protein H4R34_003035 [Dimargaris verticillata]